MLLDVSSIKGFLIIRRHKTAWRDCHGVIVLLSPFYLPVNLAALESGRCFLSPAALVFVFFSFKNGFNTHTHTESLHLERENKPGQITSSPRVAHVVFFLIKR